MSDIHRHLESKPGSSFYFASRPDATASVYGRFLDFQLSKPIPWLEITPGTAYYRVMGEQMKIRSAISGNFSSIEEIKALCIRFDPSEVSIWILVDNDDDEELCDRIYEKQRALYRQLSGIPFRFRLTDIGTHPITEFPSFDCLVFPKTVSA